MADGQTVKVCIVEDIIELISQNSLDCTRFPKILIKNYFSAASFCNFA